MALDTDDMKEWSGRFANRLENLVAKVRQHPGLNWSSWNPGNIYVENAAEMAAAVQAIGGPWEKKSTDYDFRMVQKGDDNHFTIIISGTHESVCVQVGEEAVETVTPITESIRQAVMAGVDSVVTTKMKPIWSCPPSILKEGGEVVVIDSPFYVGEPK